MLEALAGYHRKDRYGFSPPGHRQGRGADESVRAVVGSDLFRADVLARGGLDDWRAGSGILTDAEQLMADAVGAETAFFSTCGSSLSVRAAMMAVAGGSGGGLLLPRDSHKSIVGGLIFSGIRPRWIAPRWDAERHFCHPPSPERVAGAWEEHPDAAGALVVSPSPYGTCADLHAIAEICHQRGKPLIVDEAWGAHLPFHQDLPTWAMDAGADVCVVSVHKMGAGFEQGSVYHVQGDLVDRNRLTACADLLMTTSPSVPIYAALDGWRRQMVAHGHELLSAALELAHDVRQRIDTLPGVEVLEDVLLGAEASHDLDRLQVLVDVSGTGTSGYQARDWLREHTQLLSDMGGRPTSGDTFHDQTSSENVGAGVSVRHEDLLRNECLDTSTPSGGPPHFKLPRRQQPLRSLQLEPVLRSDHRPHRLAVRGGRTAPGAAQHIDHRQTRRPVGAAVGGFATYRRGFLSVLDRDGDRRTCVFQQHHRWALGMA